MSVDFLGAVLKIGIHTNLTLDILNSGEVPNLFESDEVTQIRDGREINSLIADIVWD